MMLIAYVNSLMDLIYREATSFHTWERQMTDLEWLI
jgi:hypothetical protein